MIRPFYYSNRDLYVAALLSVGFQNPSKNNRALMAYMNRIAKSI